MSSGIADFIISMPEQSVGLNRRTFLLATAFVPLAGKVSAAELSYKVAFQRRMAELEFGSGGRLGVAVLDCTNGRVAGYRLSERFPFCSTFKVLLVAAVLSWIDSGLERMDCFVPYTDRDVLGYAPVTKAHLAEGGMTIDQLCAAAIELSDNTAANLLLRKIGGAESFNKFVRTLGDTMTRLDHAEPDLNAAIPGSQEDTTSPRSMVRDLEKVLSGNTLSERSRKSLQMWMINAQTGLNRLRAGLPANWIVGDKTGSGDNGTANIVAIMWPPEQPPLLAGIFLTGARIDSKKIDFLYNQIGKIIAAEFRN